MDNIESKPMNNTLKSSTKIIGITGGIGSGKSMVSQFIISMGYPVYNSDIAAKQIVNENSELKKNIIDLLGNEAYDLSGNYNRKLVAEKVFNNDELLLKLNSIVHPAVKNHFEDWITAQSCSIVFKETALLFELNLNKECWKTIAVTAEDNIRMKRVMERDNKTYREVEAIMNKQMPEREKIKKADYVIYNNTDIQSLEKETREVIAEIVSSIQEE